MKLTDAEARSDLCVRHAPGGHCDPSCQTVTTELKVHVLPKSNNPCKLKKTLFIWQVCHFNTFKMAYWEIFWPHHSAQPTLTPPRRHTLDLIDSANLVIE